MNLDAGFFSVSEHIENNGYYEVNFQNNNIENIQVISGLGSRIWLKTVF